VARAEAGRRARGVRSAHAARGGVLGALEALPQHAGWTRAHLPALDDRRPAAALGLPDLREPLRARAALAVLVAEVPGRRRSRSGVAGRALPPAPRLGPDVAAPLDARPRGRAEPPDRQEP